MSWPEAFVASIEALAAVLPWVAFWWAMSWIAGGRGKDGDQ